MRWVPRWVVAVEIGAMAALILSFIWVWQGSFPGDNVVCVLLYAGIGIAVLRVHGESAREIGFRLDNAVPAALQALRYVGPLVLLPVAAGWALGSIRPASPASWIPAVLWLSAWGTGQQYGLLCVFYRRFGELLPGRWAPMAAAGFAFALFHLPNPFLTVVTFGAGVLACWLYRRVPNVWVLGVAHGVLSLFLSRCLPQALTGGMRVGPGFWRYMEMLRAGMIGP